MPIEFFDYNTRKPSLSTKWIFTKTQIPRQKIGSWNTIFKITHGKPAIMNFSKHDKNLKTSIMTEESLMRLLDFCGLICKCWLNFLGVISWRFFSRNFQPFKTVSYCINLIQIQITVLMTSPHEKKKTSILSKKKNQTALRKENLLLFAKLKINKLNLKLKKMLCSIKLLCITNCPKHRWFER